MNPELQERINDAFHTMQQLLSRNFPEIPAEPNDGCSWESWRTFLADAPDRLIHVIALDYHDCVTYEEDEDDKPCDELFEDYDRDYEGIYQQCVKNITAVWGQGNVVTGKDMRAWFYRNTHLAATFAPFSPAFFETTPSVLLNPERILWNDCRLEFTYWIREDKIALTHYAGDKGDDDFQFAVSIAVVPLHVPNNDDE